MVRRLFRDYPGNLAVRLWDGNTLSFGTGAPDVCLSFRHPGPLRELVLFHDPMRLAEAYFRCAVDVEGNIYAALALKDHLQSLTLTTAEKLALLTRALLLDGTPSGDKSLPESGHRPLSIHASQTHSKSASREAIAYHYDVSDAFYRLWLDEQMVYSCAYFTDTIDSLDQAQRNKLDYICRKLRLRPGDHLLDIGCGWGALICWAAKYHGVRAYGITLSRNQYEYCLARINMEGLQDRVSVELKDYRDLRGVAKFDKIISVGMFEHVGTKNLPLYFGIAWNLLKPDGLFLNHGITHDREGWNSTVETRFINRYVFPDGELDTVGNVQRVQERSGFEILDVEAWRPHYVLTLRHWVRRLEDRKAEALRHVSETIYRVWHLYMAACALCFERGNIGVYQILSAKHGTWPPPVPLTRRDMYD